MTDSQPLISLCLITGNCEDYITRCLESFAPLADEIIVVRAIGSQEPDGTLDRIAVFREKHGLGESLRVFDYWNKPEHADWPHVDSFAAARNRSFDLATGRYCFWCDTDDLLISGAAQIREHAERYEYAVHLFPYEIPAQGLSVPRERLILRGSGRWRYPVHECFLFPIQQAAGYEDPRVVISHRPFNSKSGSNERNLRILRSIPDEELNAGLLYHLHCELLGIGDQAGAVDAARRAMECPDSGKAERYEMLMNFGRCTENPQIRESYFHAAFQHDPTRREALGLLAGNAMDFGRPDLGLTFARLMMATTPPASTEWNTRGSFYGWIGDDIFEQAHRYAGINDGNPALIVEAERLRCSRLQSAGGALISLVHATRGRPLLAVQTRKAWLDLADHPTAIEHIFIFDQDDEASQPLSRFHHIMIPAGGGCVAAWNQGAFASRGAVILQLSDDFRPFPSWDSAILDRIGDCSIPRVLAVSDGFRTDRLLCMAIVTRDWLKRECFLFHPDFTGVYSDNWFTDQAYGNGEVIEARDLVFEHRHPIALGTPVDATYAAQNAPERYTQGLEVYERLQQGRDWSSAPGFFDYWGFYRDVVAARLLQDGDLVVEVGVWLGRSLICLAQACQRLGKKVTFYAVDTFVGEKNQPAHIETVSGHGGSLRDAFIENCRRCGVAEMINVMEVESVQAAATFEDASLKFCFVDAAHDYESVCHDLRAWTPKIQPGGLLAGHDIVFPDVQRAVADTLTHYQRAGSIWLAPAPALQ